MEDAPWRLSSTSRPEVFGARRKAVGEEEMNEFVFAAGRVARVVGASLLADGGGALTLLIWRPQSTCAVGWKDFGCIGKFEEFFLKALVGGARRVVAGCGRWRDPGGLRRLRRGDVSL